MKVDPTHPLIYIWPALQLLGTDLELVNRPSSKCNDPDLKSKEEGFVRRVGSQFETSYELTFSLATNCLTPSV